MCTDEWKTSSRAEQPAAGDDLAPAWAVLALLLVPGAGPARVAAALAQVDRCGQPLPGLLGQSLERLVQLFVPGAGDSASVVAACDPGCQRRGQDLTARAQARDFRAIRPHTSSFPPYLATRFGEAAPPLLFCRGALECLAAPTIGIVGARRAAPRALALARRTAAAAARAGVTVVSGGARGVDAAAHGAALAAGGATVIVLPQGALSYEKPSAYGEAMRAGRVLLLSEFVPDLPWCTHAAVQRNATISVLSDGLCVIAPAKQGGSIRTARCAIERAKPVFHAYAPASPLFRARGTHDVAQAEGAARLEAWLAGDRRPAQATGQLPLL